MIIITLKQTKTKCKSHLQSLENLHPLIFVTFLSFSLCFHLGILPILSVHSFLSNQIKHKCIRE